MNKTTRSRQRILSVRNMQRTIATGRASEARKATENLQMNAQQLAMLRAQAFQTQHCTMAQDMQANMELGSRLIKANEQLTHALNNAKKNQEKAEKVRISAWIDHKAAGKLLDKAKYYEQVAEERKIAELPQSTQLKRKSKRGQK